MEPHLRYMVRIMLIAVLGTAALAAPAQADSTVFMR
jgi:hypothetical protein